MMDNSKLLMLNFTMEENEKLKRAITISGMKNKTSDFFNAKLNKFFDINNGSYESFYDYSLDISLTFRGYLAKHSTNGSLYGYYPGGNSISYMVIVNDDVFTKLIELYNAAPADITNREIGIIAISAIMVAVDMDVNTTTPQQQSITAIPNYMANTMANTNAYIYGMCNPTRNPFTPIFPNANPALFPMKQKENVNPVKPVVGQPEIGQPVQTDSLPKLTSELIKDVMGAAKVSGKPINNGDKVFDFVDEIRKFEKLIYDTLGIENAGYETSMKLVDRLPKNSDKYTINIVNTSTLDMNRVSELTTLLNKMDSLVTDIVTRAICKGLIHPTSVTSSNANYIEFALKIPNYSFKKLIIEWANDANATIKSTSNLPVTFRYYINVQTMEIISHISPVVIVK
jgi:hypothetical protein